MNKAELVDAIAKQTGLSKKDSEKAVTAFVDAVTKTLKKKGKVQLVGFGTFETAKRAARNGKNPQTGATSVLARSPIVLTFILRSFSAVCLPTKRRSATGSGHIFSFQFSSEKTVVASGFL